MKSIGRTPDLSPIENLGDELGRAIFRPSNPLESLHDFRTIVRSRPSPKFAEQNRIGNYSNFFLRFSALVINKYSKFKKVTAKLFLHKKF